MKITLTLEQDVAVGLNAEARQSGRAFKDVVNECLRAGLKQLAMSRGVPRFSVHPRDFGALQPGVSLNDIGGLLERF